MQWRMNLFLPAICRMVHAQAAELFKSQDDKLCQAGLWGEEGFAVWFEISISGIESWYEIRFESIREYAQAMSLHMGAATDARAGVIALVDTLWHLYGIEQFLVQKVGCSPSNCQPNLYSFATAEHLVATYYCTYILSRASGHTHTHACILQYHFYVVVATRQVLVKEFMALP